MLKVAIQTKPPTPLPAQTSQPDLAIRRGSGIEKAKMWPRRERSSSPKNSSLKKGLK